MTSIFLTLDDVMHFLLYFVLFNDVMGLNIRRSNDLSGKEFFI